MTALLPFKYYVTLDIGEGGGVGIVWGEVCVGVSYAFLSISIVEVL